MSEAVIKGFVKFCMLKEALASCQMEGVGKDVTIEDLYLEDLKEKKDE